MFDRGMFMKSIKSQKMSLLVIRTIVALTGVLMFAFQNCSRINTLQISDIAGKAGLANELAANNNPNDNVNVQIELANGDVLAVDSVGNETVVNNNSNTSTSAVVNNNNSSTGTITNSNTSNGSGASSDAGQAVQQPVNDQPILVTGDDGIEDEDVADLDLCVAEEQNKKDHKYEDRDDDTRDRRASNKNTLASYKKIKCKIKKDKKRDGIRCMDLAREHGITIIDLAKLDNVNLINSIKGKTLIMSSDRSKTYIRSLIIQNAVGKTILCGVSIARLDVKKGNLEMREGASIKSCGEINGHIFKDEESHIDGSDSE